MGIALFDEKESNISGRSSSKATSLSFFFWSHICGTIFHLQLYTLLELEVKLVAPKRVFTSTSNLIGSEAQK